MKTDDNYIYPETAEELAMFYGWLAETQMRDEKWVKGHIMIGDLKEIKINFTPYRLPLPTISDLKVGDVVRSALYDLKCGGINVIETKKELELVKENINRKVFTYHLKLLIGRNTWVPVKCN